jgi:hypothetical protein
MGIDRENKATHFLTSAGPLECTLEDESSWKSVVQPPKGYIRKVQSKCGVMGSGPPPLSSRYGER